MTQHNGIIQYCLLISGVVSYTFMCVIYSLAFDDACLCWAVPSCMVMGMVVAMLIRLGNCVRELKRLAVAAIHPTLSPPTHLTCASTWPACGKTTENCAAPSRASMPTWHLSQCWVRWATSSCPSPWFPDRCRTIRSTSSQTCKKRFWFIVRFFFGKLCSFVGSAPNELIRKHARTATFERSPHLKFLL